ETPGFSPASRSAWRIQFRSVSPEQPIFSAMEVMAAHWDGYSPACSLTSRTVRSLTSAEYLVAFDMTPTSQVLEPPAIPGRFKLWIRHSFPYSQSGTILFACGDWRIA